MNKNLWIVRAVPTEGMLESFTWGCATFGIALWSIFDFIGSSREDDALGAGEDEELLPPFAGIECFFNPKHHRLVVWDEIDEVEYIAENCVYSDFDEMFTKAEKAGNWDQARELAMTLIIWDYELQLKERTISG